MIKLTFIGDVHGKVEQYHQITRDHKFTMCAGDFGWKQHWEYHRKFIGTTHWVNPGNHDYDGAYNDQHYSMSTGNFKYFRHIDVFTVRGADSIDKHLRIEGIDWFSNEELNYQEQLEAFDAYVAAKPRIMLTHDCPQSVMTELFGYPEKSQTRTMLEMMFQEHKPELWVFGHHHKSIKKTILGTEFVCLDELETMSTWVSAKTIKLN